MSLEHAILGFLNYRPFSGYDLKKIFDTSVRHFWPADQSQIYRTLNRLTQKGWAEMEVIEQENRPDRKEYSITAAGQEALRQWLVIPLSFGDNRSAPLVQVFFAGQLSNDEIIAMYQRVADFMRMGLKQYEHIPQEMEAYADCVQSQREFFFWMQTLEIGKMMARTNLEWIENVIAQLKTGQVPEK
ncbi:MAG: PadR family transcriptional regulator [Anaerolineales bacterium]|nr:PadR family transcriptional regulator [Anaerolineales bacterium]